MNDPGYIHALLQWAEDKELEAHSIWCDDCEFLNDCRINEDEVRTDILCAQDVREKDFHEMAEKIQNMQANQWPRARKV